MKFYEETIREFLSELESDLPAPGGGSVAGLVAAISAALNSMVYSLTVGKKSYLQLSKDEQITIKRFQKESKEFKIRSLELMDEDKENFLKLMGSYKMPKATTDEIEKRKSSIRENTIKAMEVPLILARESLAFYDNLVIMSKYGNKMLLSDLGISAILLHSAIESSIINVKVNLNSLKNEEFFENIDMELKEIFKSSQKFKDDILNIVNISIY